MYKAQSKDDMRDIAIGFGVLLLVLGLVFHRLVNRFYAWWRDQRLTALLAEIESRTSTNSQLERMNSIVDEYQSKLTLEFPETLKAQMISSEEFRNSVLEAARLLAEYVVFTSSQHTDQEQASFTQEWRLRLDRFADRVASKDPVAVEVILKTIERESANAAEGN